MRASASPSTVIELRERIARLEGRPRRAKSVLPFGIPVIDSRLPGGGLARGALHEVAGGGNGAADCVEVARPAAAEGQAGQRAGEVGN
jgi:protein ImuA